MSEGSLHIKLRSLGDLKRRLVRRRLWPSFQEQREELADAVCLNRREALDSFLHGGGGPSQGHRGRGAGVSDVAADLWPRCHDIPTVLVQAERAAQSAGEDEPGWDK